MDKCCGTCGVKKKTSVEWCEKMYLCKEGYTEWIPDGIITFHRLNGLTPTFSSCRDKVYEEIGELMQLLGKGQQASGEQNTESSYPDWVYRVVEEALDSAQALVTLINTLAEENNIIIPGEVERHEAKLKEKGYLK